MMLAALAYAAILRCIAVSSPLACSSPRALLSRGCAGQVSTSGPQDVIAGKACCVAPGRPPCGTIRPPLALRAQVKGGTSLPLGALDAPGGGAAIVAEADPLAQVEGADAAVGADWQRLCGRAPVWP